MTEIFRSVFSRKRVNRENNMGASAAGERGYYPRRANLRPARVEFSKLRFLLVEDFPAFQKLHEAKLLEAGVPVIDIVSGAEEAIRMFRESPTGYYHVILTDLHIPGMSGFELAAAIRRMEREDAGTVVIIAVSCLIPEDGCIREKDVNMDDYLTKPLNIEGLRASLQRFLQDKCEKE